MDKADRFEYSEQNVKRLKEKYLEEIKSEQMRVGNGDDENPIRTCMRIMFEAANERDPIKRRQLAYNLSKFLTRPDGLINLFLALIDFDVSSQKVTTHNQRFIAVANIIAHLPQICMPYLDYCDNIASQLRPLLVHPDTRYSSLSSLILKSLLESPHANRGNLSSQAIENVILDPFLKAFSQKTDIVLDNSIIAIHNLIQNHVPSKLFVGHASNLFYALVTLYKTPSQLKKILIFILNRIICDLKPGHACCLFEQIILCDEKRCNIYDISTNSDHIGLELQSQNDLDGESNFEVIRQVLYKLLEERASEDDSFVLEFFFHFQSKMWTAIDEESGFKCVQLIEPLLIGTLEENATNKLDLLTSISSNSKRTLDLISRTLINYLDFIRLKNHDRDRDILKVLNQSINSCLDILEVLLSANQISGSTFRSSEIKILSTLKEIKKIMCDREEENFDEKLVRSITSLIDRLSKEPDYYEVPKKNDLISREYDEALKDLNDKLVPVRVHALVQLKNLIVANCTYTISQIPQLFSMIECSLADQEPYVFLACINLLAEMSVRNTEAILPRLMELYTNKSLDLQQRINVGEVLVRLVRRLHKMTPFYAQRIIGAFLLATENDEEELIRMSSLTNLGEIGRNLGDSLGKYTVDILNCVERILDSDTIPTKCAAIELLRSTLMGIDRLTVESIQQELGSIYKLLKKLKSNTLDEKLCFHVDLASDEIGRLAKELLLGSQDLGDSGLVKNIKFLSLLD